MGTWFLDGIFGMDDSADTGTGGGDAFPSDQVPDTSTSVSADPCQSYDPFDLIKCAGNAVGSFFTSATQPLINPVTNELNFLLIVIVAAILVIVALIAFHANDLAKIFDIKVIA